ncbi:MAG: hypothetical protein ACI90V_004823 [Bacillariaceae sp.]|jgi:hypothetical protein
MTSSETTTTEKNNQKGVQLNEIDAVLRKKKQLPSVTELLRHGDPETAHLPKTWKETVGYPLALAIVFAISLLVFHHAPRSPLVFKPTNIKRLKMFQGKKKSFPPHLMKNEEKKKETEL